MERRGSHESLVCALCRQTGQRMKHLAWTQACILSKARTTSSVLVNGQSCVSLITVSIFISIWVPTTGFVTTGDSFCTGIFYNYNQIMDSQISPKKLPQPYSPLLRLLWLAILFFMVSVKIRLRRISLDGVDDNSVKIGVQRPKDLDSMLLNFTIMILLLINVLGFHLFWRK